MLLLRLNHREYMYLYLIICNGHVRVLESLHSLQINVEYRFSRVLLNNINFNGIYYGV